MYSVVAAELCGMVADLRLVIADASEVAVTGNGLVVLQTEVIDDGSREALTMLS